MAKRRELTAEEKLWAKNLKAIWLAQKDRLGLSQMSAAFALGYKTQSAFSQYVNGAVPLHTDAKVAIANLLQVDVTAIDPNFYANLRRSDSPDAELTEILLELNQEQKAQVVGFAKGLARGGQPIEPSEEADNQLRAKYRADAEAMGIPVDDYLLAAVRVALAAYKRGDIVIDGPGAAGRNRETGEDVSSTPPSAIAQPATGGVKHSISKDQLYRNAAAQKEEEDREANSEAYEKKRLEDKQREIENAKPVKPKAKAPKSKVPVTPPPKP